MPLKFDVGGKAVGKSAVMADGVTGDSEENNLVRRYCRMAHTCCMCNIIKATVDKIDMGDMKFHTIIQENRGVCKGKANMTVKLCRGSIRWG